MRVPAILKTFRGSGSVVPSAPPAIWSAFQAQASFKSWVIVALLGLITLETFALARLASRPLPLPEYVLVDSDGKATFVKKGVATDALLRFLAEKTRPPDLTVVRFTQDLLKLGVALNSATIDANWPAFLGMMAPELRSRVEKESASAKLVEGYKLSQQKTDISIEDVVLVTKTPTLLHVRTTITRRRGSTIDRSVEPTVDRIAIDLVEAIVPARLDRPDGLELVDWHVEQLSEKKTKPTSITPETADGP